MDPDPQDSAHSKINSPAFHPAQILRQARGLQLKVDSRSLASLAGAYHSARPGTGLSFSELRPYEAGDDVRHIDWNVSARQERPYVRHYTEERALTLWIAVDVSPRMNFGRHNQTKADRACQAAALLAATAIQNGDRVGLALISDTVAGEIQPGGGIRQLSRLIRLLSTATGDFKTSDLSPVTEMFGLLTRRALLFILSDFRPSLDPHAWRMLSARHKTIALRISDPLEETLPHVGLIAAVDPDTGIPQLIDTASPTVREQYQEAAKERRLTFERFCHEVKITGWQLSTADEPILRLRNLFRHTHKLTLGRHTRAGKSS